MRVPFAQGVESALSVREWTVVDQILPLPFYLVEKTLFTDRQNGWTPSDQMPGTLLEPQTRRYASLRVHHDGGGGLGSIDESEFETNTYLTGRSVWNTRWILIIPGRFLFQGVRRVGPVLSGGSGILVAPVAGRQGWVGGLGWRGCQGIEAVHRGLLAQPAQPFHPRFSLSDAEYLFQFFYG